MSAEKNISILLVEDEENLHEALKLNLELEGYNVTSAYDGVGALNAVTAEYFDLIIPGCDASGNGWYQRSRNSTHQ